MSEQTHDTYPELDDEPTPEFIESLKETLDEYVDRLHANTPPEVTSRIKEAKYWVQDHRVELQRAALVVGGVIVLVKLKKRFGAKEVAEAVEDAIELKVSAGDAARLQAGLSELFFEDTEFGNFVLRAGSPGANLTPHVKA